MKEYKINKYGICLNPDIYGTDCNFIKVAKFPDGKWRFGCSINSNGGNFFGCGFGCGFGLENKHDIYAYNTERDCIIAGAKFIELQIKRHKELGINTDYSDIYKAIDIIRSKYQPIQLELF